MRRSRGEKIFTVFNTVFLILIAAVTLYPFLYVVFASLSNPVKLLVNRGPLLWPAGFSLAAYKKVFQNPYIYIGYGNTLFYVIVGTAANIFATSVAAYVLSRQNFMMKRFFTVIFIFTMYFSGGLIPSYLLMDQLNLINNRLVLILPTLVSTYNLLILINGFQGVPVSLEESARIDGAGEWRILSRVIVPLAKPTIMVIMLYYAVGHWNSWFNAMIYLRSSAKMPLQMYLRSILTMSQLGAMLGDTDIEDVGTTIKYATIVVSTVPILCIYPLIQKHFVQGVLIGAVKE